MFYMAAGNIYGYKPEKAAIVMNADTQEVLYSESADSLRHPASLTKKMTLYMLFEALQEGTITKKTTFTVSKLACSQIPSKLGVAAGESVSVETIIKSLVTKSANDMAVVAAEGLGGSLSNFVQLMNKRARELGMKRTTFTNSSGVPDKRQWTTARDMAILGQALYNDFPQYWQYFQLRHFSHNGTIHRTHNHLLNTYPGSDGIKTGFVNASGFNVSTSAVRYTPSGAPVRLFVVIMGGNTRHERDRRVINLMNKYFDKLGATRIHKNAVSETEPSKIHMVQNAVNDAKLKPLNLALLNKVSSDAEATRLLTSMLAEGLTTQGSKLPSVDQPPVNIAPSLKAQIKPRKKLRAQKKSTRYKKRRGLAKKVKNNI